MSNDNPAQVLEAVESFVTEGPDGRTVVVQKGRTRISADHWLAERFSQHFQRVADHLTYDTEEASAEPGRGRARPPARQEVAAQVAPPAAKAPAATAKES